MFACFALTDDSVQLQQAYGVSYYHTAVSSLPRRSAFKYGILDALINNPVAAPPYPSMHLDLSVAVLTVDAGANSVVSRKWRRAEKQTAKHAQVYSLPELSRP